MVVLCKSSAGLRFYLFIQLFIFIYLLFTIFKIERWQKQYMRNFKTIMYWANWWLFYTARHKACQRRDPAWAGHLKPHKVKKCWRQPSASTRLSLQTRWHSSLCPSPLGFLYAEGEWGLLTLQQQVCTSDDSASPFKVCHRILVVVASLGHSHSGQASKCSWNLFLNS